ncbi:hypothetical protein BS78_03G145300 [Paspalum vaginatum]|nr:hypothetical protein BS78_03G145300 [Paspalum vaginatum]
MPSFLLPPFFSLKFAQIQERHIAIRASYLSLLQGIASRCGLQFVSLICEVGEDGTAMCGVERELPGNQREGCPCSLFFWATAGGGSGCAYEQDAFAGGLLFAEYVWVWCFGASKCNLGLLLAGFLILFHSSGISLYLIMILQYLMFLCFLSLQASVLGGSMYCFGFSLSLCSFFAPGPKEKSTWSSRYRGSSYCPATLDREDCCSSKRHHR